MVSETVVLNGRFIPYEQALIPIEDRGNLFADGIYEVIRYIGGHPFELQRHLDRLAASAAAISLSLPFQPTECADSAARLVTENGLDKGPDADATVYIQVSRGPARRSHAFPSSVHPTWFMIARPFRDHDRARIDSGVTAVTLTDSRWTMCHIKSIALLPNILAKQEAVSRGAFEGLFVRDQLITEGTSSNFFAVSDNTLFTYPESGCILSGVTRAVVIELVRALGISFAEQALPAARLHGCSEAFLTGSTTGVMPLVAVDGKPIGDGRPGPITLRLYEAFAARISATRYGSVSA